MQNSDIKYFSAGLRLSVNEELYLCCWKFNILCNFAGFLYNSRCINYLLQHALLYFFCSMSAEQMLYCLKHKRLCATY